MSSFGVIFFRIIDRKNILTESRILITFVCQFLIQKLVINAFEYKLLKKINMKINLERKNLLIIVLSLMMFMVSCNNGSKTHDESNGYVEKTINNSFKIPDRSKVYVEKVMIYDDAVLGIIKSYTSGIISGDEFLKIEFLSDLKLKKQYGETLPSKIFDISPKVKGQAIWIDKNIVGFQFDKKPQTGTLYNVRFDLSAFIDISEENKYLDYSFLVGKQDFYLGDVSYLTDNENTCVYTLDLLFSYPIDDQSLYAILNDKVKNNYTCEFFIPLSNNKIQLIISDIPRKSSTYDINIKLDGSAVGIDRVIEKSVTIPSKDEFYIINHIINTQDRKIIINYTHPLDVNQNLAGYIELSDNNSYSTEIFENSIIIYCTGKYSVDPFDLIVYNGIKSASGNTYNDRYEIKNINLKKLNPSLHWTNEGNILPEVSGNTIYFDAVCLKEVILKIVKIYDNNILNFLQSNNLESTYNIRRVGRLVKKIRIPLEGTDYSKRKTYPIVLSDYVDVKPGEIYQIILDFDMKCYPYPCDIKSVEKTYDESYWDNETYDYNVYYYSNNYRDRYNPCRPAFYNYVNIEKNILISNIAVTAKSSDNNFLDVFVRNISDAEPVNHADVYLYNYQMQQIGKSKTDVSGYARVDFDSKPYFLIVQDNSGNKSFLQLEKNKSLSISKFNVSGNTVKHHVNGFVYSNRDVWRPGDSLQINLMLSDKENYFTEQYPVVMELYDPNGRLYNKKVNNSSIGKIYAFTVKTSVTDPTGTWHANFKIGNQIFTKNIRIETVKPNRLRIDYDMPEMVSITKNDKAFLSSCRLNGMEVSDLKADITVNLSNAKTSFKNYSQYCFDNEANTFTTTEETLFSSSLSPQGTATVSYTPLDNIKAPGILNARYVIKVFESNADFSITSKAGKISPFSRYVGVELPETKSRWGKYYFTDQDWNFNVAVVNEDGSLSEGNIDLDLQVYKLDSYWWWDNERKYELMRYVKGSYKRPVIHESLTCKKGKANFKLHFKAKEWGSYVIIINDIKGGHTFSKVVNFDEAYGVRSSSLADAPTFITLKSDKEEYKVGDTMKIYFPANEKSKAIVTVESASEVIKHLSVDHLDEDVFVKIPVTSNMLPNVYVSVALIQPYNKDNGLPIRMYGILPVSVIDDKSVLNPVIEAPETSTSNKTVDIKVSEKEGRPMYYTLAVVDEGILGMTGYRTPNPYKYFFSKQALNIRTWDNYDAIVNAYTEAMKGGLATGGDLFIAPDETTLFERFAAIATMMGPFKLEAGQSLTHQFDIPDYNGSLRVMLVASNGKEAFGSTQKNITVKDRIMLVPTAPRVVSPGDEVELKMLILAPELVNNKVNLDVKMNNLQIVNEDIVKSVTIEENGKALSIFKVKVPEVAGTASFTVTASCNGFSTKKSVFMPVRLPSSDKYNSVLREVKAGESQTLQIESQGFDGTIQTKLVANTGIPVNLFRRIDYLVSYPYGCLEQKVSRAFPQLYLNDLVALDETAKADMKFNVEDVIASMNEYICSNYSMTNWPNGKYVDYWTELYALHFLIEALNQGYNVSKTLINGMIKYQSNRAKTWNYSIDDPSGELLQAYRLFVLALNNTPEIGAMNRFKDLDKKYILTQALTATAYALTGKMKIAEKQLPVMDYSQNTCMSNYYLTYGSKIRDMAFCTYAEMLVNNNLEMIKNDIDELCRILSSDKWLDTQSTAFSIFVLGKYAARKGVKNDVINIIVNDAGDIQNLTANKSSLSVNLKPKKGMNEVLVKNNGNESVFVTLSTKGKVAEFVTEESGSRCKMSVRYYDRKGNEINPDKLSLNTDFSVEIKVSNPYEYMLMDNALSYYLPSGWEMINDRLFKNESTNDEQCKNIEYQDDNVKFYFDLLPNQEKTFRLSLNAAYQGKFMIPAVHCESMYNDEVYYTVPARQVVVDER